ncbi:Protein of unknown function [Pyronema omphalodes CBS 100304]|uniref:Uncharacterized protein n=1 Tax=Pyronema omphalodes (strain CBS 100304) TaxID=1076935 RepID=U4KV32_PYROM|nr:Protein of unknown function [Pyronema omphalodes CBS 100304]
MNPFFIGALTAPGGYHFGSVFTQTTGSGTMPAYVCLIVFLAFPRIHKLHVNLHQEYNYHGWFFVMTSNQHRQIF